MCLPNKDLWLQNMVPRQLTNKLKTAQRARERKLLNLKLGDKIPCSEIRKRTKMNDIIDRIHAEAKMEVGRTYNKNEGQQVG